MIRRCVWALLLLWVTGPASAAIVFVKGQSQPLRGFLVQETDSLVVVREVLPSGATRDHRLQRDQIEDILRTVSAERLAGLSPDDPAEYRHYAEELAIKKEDPEARATAMRLYLIAAWLQPEELARSCLLGMADLARTPDEERSCRALAFLLDPGHDATLLKPASPTPPAAIPEADRSALRIALRHLRSGRENAARSILERESIRAAAAHYGHILDREDYQALLRASGRLTPALRRKMLKLEIALSSAGAAEPADDPTRPAPWSELMAREQFSPVTSLSLAGITEFDPRACLYRDGQWVVPREE